MIRISVLFMALCVFTNAFAQDQASQSSSPMGYLLEYKPAVGTNGKMNMNVNMTMSTKAAGMDIDIKQQMKMVTSISIINQNARTTTSRFEYDYITTIQENPYAGTINYDSRNPDLDNYLEKAIHDAMSSLLDTTMVFTQDRTGKNVKDPGEKGTGLASSGQQGSGASVDASNAMNMFLFPKEPIKVGDSWTQVQDDESTYMGLRSIYTLESVENGIARIKFEGTYFLNEEYNGELTITGFTGSQSGYSLCRLSDMWLLESHTSQDFTMTMNVAGSETSSRNISRTDITVE